MRPRPPHLLAPGAASSKVPARSVRRGAMLAVGAAGLVCALGFAALSVDTSLIVLTRIQQQNAVDAAALAAAEEIALVIEASGSEEGSKTGLRAEIAARALAARVASLNGVYVDAQRDVEFGKRYYNSGTGLFRVEWGGRPFNAVRVTARRENRDPAAPDAALNLFFAPLFGTKTQVVVTEAAAFVDARDLVLVLDYTSSMNDDSTLDAIGRLSRTSVESNMLQIYDELGLNLPRLPEVPAFPVLRGQAPDGPVVDVTFMGNSVQVKSQSSSLKKVVLTFYDLKLNQTFTQEWDAKGNDKTFTGTGSNAKLVVMRAEVTTKDKRTAVINYTVDAVKAHFGLDAVPYPYPDGSWDDFVWKTFETSYTALSNNSKPLKGHEWKLGQLTLVNYLLEDHCQYSQTPDLWKTSHYPFHAMKNGASLLCKFLDELQFGDHLGLVSYYTSARIESVLDMPAEGLHIDISAAPITADYNAIDIIQRHKQAGHYGSRTGIGYGMSKGIELLQTHGRYGARPTLLLMSDGNANAAPAGFTLPSDWDWAAMTDYDGNGSPDYTTSDVNKQFAFYYVREAARLGYTVHTMAVGSGSDPSFMRSVAFAGGGTFIHVPGGNSIDAMESQLRDGFKQIAAKMPPARLLIER